MNMEVRERLETKIVTNYNDESIRERKRINNIMHSGEKSEADLKECLLCLNKLSSTSWCNIYECCGGIVCDDCSNNCLKEYVSKNHKSAMKAFHRSINDDFMGTFTSIAEFAEILRCPQCRDSQKPGPNERLSYLRVHLGRQQSWAYYALSIAYRDGENGVLKDCEEGWKICQQGREKEYPALQFLWAQAQFKGNFGDFELSRVNRSADHYMGTLEAAAKGGHPGAQDLLAYHYWHGIGTTANKAEAIRNFRLSLATQFDFDISRTRTKNIMCMDEDTSFFHECLQDLMMDDKAMNSNSINVNVVLFWAVQQFQIFGPQMKVLEDLLRVLSKVIELLHSGQEGEVQGLRTEYKYIRCSLFKSLIGDIDFEVVLKETCASCGSCSRDGANQLIRCEGCELFHFCDKCQHSHWKRGHQNYCELFK